MGRRRYTPGMEYGQGSRVKEFVTYVAAMADQRQEQAMSKTQQLILQAMRRDVTKREAECLEDELGTEFRTGTVGDQQRHYEGGQ